MNGKLEQLQQSVSQFATGTMMELKLLVDHKGDDGLHDSLENMGRNFTLNAKLVTD
uniref:Uncharacterized protein n=1 Tax=Onchocerca volvulus TaxID=6282 RepID=A0A8R1TXA7_ONCVO